ncbi:MAG: copper chaperone PCu(A)C [Methyloceanibacter sp.]
MHHLHKNVSAAEASGLGRLCTWLAVATVQVGIILLPVQGTFAEEATASSISIEHAWSRATPQGAQVAVGYLTIKNNGTAPDRLVSASAEIAGHTEVHQMSMTDGVMQMRQVTDGLPVPAKSSVVLEPNSYHLMFLDLKRQLQEGEQFSGALTFEKAGTIDVKFDVEGIGATAPKPNDHGHKPAH